MKKAWPGAALSAAAATGIANFPSRFRRKMSQGLYHPEVDGLRFFAIAFVVFGHSLERAARFFPSYRDSLAGGQIERYIQVAPFGVHLFFAISGFILANQAIRANCDPLGGAFLKSYFGRRVLRIEPPYFLLLIATRALIGVTGYVPDGTHRFYAEPQSLNWSLLGSLLYVHDLSWGTFPRLFGPGWSLEVEVQFYLLAPLLFWIWAKLEAPRARIALASVFLAIGTFFSLLRLKTVGPFHVEFSLLSAFDFFWVGIALAYGKDWIASRVARWPAAVVTALGWAGLALCILLPPVEDIGWLAKAVRFLGVYVGLAAMFASTFDARSQFRRFCARPWIAVIGGACYSIYLIHLQVIQVLSSLVAKWVPGMPLWGVALALSLTAVVVVIAGLTYYVQIERRFMERDWHLRAVGAVQAWLRRIGPRHPPLAQIESAPARADTRGSLPVRRDRRIA